ncbi:MAG: hypothetical protein LBS57_05675, partial [Treponema sp.]|nr:hypothetical protein [Treponema sp.]
MNDHNALLFNADWKFLLGDPKGAQRTDYPDRTWKRIDLPHDWVIGQPFKRGEEQGYTPQNMQGFFAWEGIAWYRKTFLLSDLNEKEVRLFQNPVGADQRSDETTSSKNRSKPDFSVKSKVAVPKTEVLEQLQVYIYFGGAYRNSVVYVNGKKAGGRAYGYASFELNITALVKPGENCIALRLDNGKESPDRWYSGSGLCRNVYLRIVPPLHVKTWGLCIKTQMIRNQDHGSAAVISAALSLVNCGGAAKGRAYIQIQDRGHQTVVETSKAFGFAEPGECVLRQRLVIQKPLLWSAEDPNLYRAIVHLEDDEGNNIGRPVEVPFGVRDIEITARRGMRVNGEPVKLKGVNLHHDCGITGAAFYEAAWRRRLLALKSIGCNAIRTSHNPPAEELLDLCDELGFYVIDECFDKWKSGYYGAF